MSAVSLFGVAVPDKAIIGLVGDDASAISAELRRLNDDNPGLVATVDYALDAVHPLAVLAERRRLVEGCRRGTSVVIASWNEHLLAALCDEVWWIAHGVVFAQGDPAEVLGQWRKHVALRWREAQAGVAAPLEPASRVGDGRAVIRGVELLSAAGEPVGGWLSGEEARIRVAVEFTTAVDNPVVGILIRTRIGLNVYGTNTELERLVLGPREAGDRIQLTFSFRCLLCPGEYTLTVASHDPDGVWHEWLEDVVAFAVGDTRYTAGVANLRARAVWALY